MLLHRNLFARFLGHHQFVGTPAALITLVQRSISLFTNAASACEPRCGLSGSTLPSSSSRLRVFSSSNALSSASLSLSTIGFGVPLGANRAFQACASNWGSPASLEVGTSGNAGLRAAVPMA